MSSHNSSSLLNLNSQSSGLDQKETSSSFSRAIKKRALFSKIFSRKEKEKDKSERTKSSQNVSPKSNQVKSSKDTSSSEPNTTKKTMNGSVSNMNNIQNIQTIYCEAISILLSSIGRGKKDGIDIRGFNGFVLNQIRNSMDFIVSSKEINQQKSSFEVWKNL